MHRLVILLVIPQRQNEPSIKPMLPVSAESFSRKSSGGQGTRFSGFRKLLQLKHLQQ